MELGPGGLRARGGVGSGTPEPTACLGGWRGPRVYTGRSGPAGPGQDFCVCGSSRVASHPMLMMGRLHWLRVASSTTPLTLADALVPRSHQPCRAQLRGPRGQGVLGGGRARCGGEEPGGQTQGAGSLDLHFGASWEDVCLVSGRQLQPGEPDAESEEERSVTAEPGPELIRPRPQGSSPVYEYVTEGDGFRLPEDAPRRRRSWWKRDSGDSRTLSRMSRLESTQDGTEVTLKTDVEAGASGYSVTGGGDQGIFVKQVLKDSSAAKLFSLREGDQLLSTTIFFDNIKYEDALKILQYSEPYKVQFKIRRKLPAGVAEPGPKVGEEQDQDVADGCTETPTKTLQGDGDQQRLLPTPREGRGRRAQRERLSWPKFQALKGKRGPRRSHSSSEAYERGQGPDLSPASTDTEARLPAEEQAQEEEPGSQRRRRFPSLRLRVGSGKGPSGRGDQGGAGPAELLEDAGPSEAEQEAIGVAEEAEGPKEPALPGQGPTGDGAGPAPRLRRKKTQARGPQETLAEEQTEAGTAPGETREGAAEDTQGPQLGTARLSLKGSADQGTYQNGQPEFRIRITSLKTPKFKVAREGVPEEAEGTAPVRWGSWWTRVSTDHSRATGDDEGDTESQTMTRPQETQRTKREGGGEEGAEQKQGDDSKGGEQETEETEGRTRILKFKLPSFGWSPAKEGKGEKTTQIQETDKQKQTSVTGGTIDVEEKGKDGHGRDSRFKFKMPSFGVSAPSKAVEAAVDVSLPKAQAEATLPSVQADVKPGEVRVELPAAELEVKAAEVGVKLPEGHLPEAELKEGAAGVGIKAHLPKVQMPSVKLPKVDIKAPQVDIKGPKLDLKGAKAEVAAPDVEVSLPSVEVDTQAPGAKLEGDLSLGDKEVAARDSKFKMPKFKMPSFGVSAPSKAVEAAVDVSLPKAQAEATLPSVQADVKPGEVRVELPAAELEVKAAEVGVKLPEGHLPEAELKEGAAGVGIKAHLPKVQMPSVKLPKVDIKAPQVDIKGPKLDLKGAKAEVAAPDVEVSLPSVEVDTQAPGAKLEGDLSLGDKEVAARDSKFKMPKFKMPSFGVSAPSKAVEAAVDVSLPKAQAEATLPSVQADVKPGEVRVELPAAELEVKAAEVGVKLPEGHLPEAELKEGAAGVGIKAHLPKVQMPSVKLPKVDIKAPQVDIKGPKLDLKGAKAEVAAPDVEVSLPSVEVDTQAPGAKLEGDLSLGDKEVAARDSKFKMPKFKMPSFGVSAPSKAVEAAVDVSLPKAQAEATLPSVQADVKPGEVRVELPAAELEVKAAEVGVKLPEGHLPEAELKEGAAGVGIKAHLPKVQMPSVKLPKVDIKAPQVDIKGPKLDLKGAKAEVAAPDVEVSLPSVEVDTQAPGAKLEGDLSLGDKEVAARDSKFKMPKFKMPSFGVSAPSKAVEAAVDVSLPKAQAEATLPSVQADVKPGEVRVELPAAELEVKAAEVGVKLPEGHLPEAELKEGAAGVGIKAHLPKVQMPSVKLPKVDIKAPQVDIKGPKLDLKGAKAEVAAPDVEVSLPSVEVDTQAPGAKLEGDLSLGDKEVAARDSKFKMPKFKMPSFGVSAPSKAVEAAVDVSLPKAQAEATLPSVQADVKPGEVRVELPAAELEVKAAEVGVKLPEGHLPEAELKEGAAGVGIKAHLPKVQMPSVKLPKVDIKAPQVDIKGPKLDLKGAKAEVAAPDVEVSLPSVEVDTQAPGAKLEGDLSLGDKEVAARDSKFKMPKFKMPSFGVSAPSKAVEAAVDVSLPKAQAEATLPSVQADVKPGEVRVELPAAELEVKAAEVGVKLPEGHLPEAELKEGAAGVGIKAHLPKVQMPSVKLPKVDIKAPQVDIKGPKLDLKGAKAEVAAPDVEVSLPSVEVDTQAPGAKLEGDLSLGDKEVAARDSKFKMPKFKMPSFGVSAPSKAVEAAVDVSLPKAQAEATLPSVQADVKPGEVRVELPAAELEVKAAEVGVKLPEGHLPEAELKEGAAGVGIKAHLPKVQMPSVKLPKVDIKAPQVDIKGPKLDLKGAKAEVAAPDVEVSLPSVEVDTQAPGAKLEGDLSLGDKEVAARDSKFKMPKFKMPSFGVSAPSKAVEAAVDVSLPKAQAEATLPSVQADVKPGEVRVELPAAELEVKAAEVGVKLPEGHLPEAELKEGAAGVGIKAHLPKVQMPSVKLPKVDIKAPQVDIKGPKLDLKGAKAEVAAPDVEVSLPSVEVDTQAPGAKLEGDLSLGDKEVAARDSKFKMPKFKMPSFGVSAPSKAVEAAVDVSLPKAQAEATLPSVQADVKPGEVRVELPAAELEVKAAEVGVKLPEGHLPEAELKEGAAGVGIKAHLPKVQMPSVKLPKVDIKAPQVDIKGPKLDLKGAKAEVAAPDVEVSLPSVEVDTQAPGAKLEGDLSLGDKEAAARGRTFRTEDDVKIHVRKPHFKFPALFSSPGKSLRSSTLVEGDPQLSLPSSVSDVDPALPDVSSHKLSLPCPRVGWPGTSSGSLDVSSSHAESSAVPPEAVTLIKYQMPVPDAPHFPPEIPSCSQDDRESPATLPPDESFPRPPGSPAGPVDPLFLASYGRVTFPKFHRPKFGFSSPEAADSAVDVQAAERPPALCLPSDAQGLDSARGLPLADRSQEHGSGDVSAGLPHGEGTAQSPGDPLQPSCRASAVDAPTERSTAAPGGWFRMPALHLPIIRRPAREKGMPGAPSPTPAAHALGEEGPALIKAQGPLGSEVEAPEPLEPAEKSTSHAGVLKINLDGRGSTPHLPPPGAPPAGLSTSEVRVRPGEGSLPLQMPSGALLETEAPPAGPAGLDLARGEGRTERWSSQPEGPVKLKVSSTDGPSQVSVVSVGQPWEGSVVTVKLPRLSMPRFAFPDPGSEADVFIPAVREVQCTGSSLDDALRTESVGAWGASILKAGPGTPREQPVAFDLSPEASRVRVHIHGARGEGTRVGIHGGVMAEPADPSGPEAVSTQIVRESEIPASEIQTASYGFSLLKVKIPEPPTQGRVQDSRLTGGLQEASEDTAPGTDPVSGDLQPDTGEPFEVISSGVSIPRGPALTTNLYSGHPGTESCSDEEPAEILEFPPEEDSEEAAAGLAEGDQAPKEKPEGKRSSGLFRFWLPSIGFSSSSEETGADSKDEAHGPAPAQTPPEAEPPKKPEKAGWFRFPKLGFSSSPTKKSKSSEEEAAPAEQKLQEEAATFFDAHESFSPEDREETVPGAGAMVTSRARTELILLEPDPGALVEPAPGPAAQ
ncbi:protein AHNAK2 [Bos javanicus]|uniref:protein AHNAK2 n=1 Tax=Bos javanicus TaxID=9906 RepID=UPI002AA75973|nr:protein AHNAK2 [Bos javanicus]